MTEQYYAIVDLEMCRVPKSIRRESFHYGTELIQIGAVLLNGKYEIADSFVSFVRPEHGGIDATIAELTGITGEQVKDAPVARDALAAFAAWMPENAIPVSWSRTDEAQIRAEIEGKALELPEMEPYLARWQDCQEQFGEKMGSPRAYALAEALIIADVDYEEGAHDALVDARNTARLFAKMQTEEDFLLNSRYTAPEDAKQATYNPFAALLAGYKAK